MRFSRSLGRACLSLGAIGLVGSFLTAPLRAGSAPPDLEARAVRADGLLAARAGPEAWRLIGETLQALPDRETPPAAGPPSPAADSIATDWLLRAVRALRELGRRDESAAYLDSAAARAERIEAQRPAVVLAIAREAVRAAIAAEDLAGAYARASAALRRAIELYGAEDPRLAPDYLLLAEIHVRRDETVPAESLLALADRLVVAAEGESALTRAAGLRLQSNLAYILGDYRAAAQKSAAGLAIQERAWGASDLRLAPLLCDLAPTLEACGRLSAADSVGRRALALMQAHGVGETQRASGIYNTLGVVARRQGEQEAAVEAYRHSLRIARALEGDSSLAVGRTLVNLSAPLRVTGDHAAALRALRAGAAILEAVCGEDHRLTVWAWSHLAQTERERGDFAAAERHFRRCLDYARAAYGEDHLDVALYEIGIGQCLRDAGRLTAARRHLLVGEAIAAGVLGAEHHETLRLTTERGRLDVLAGDVPAANAVLTRCLAGLEAQLGRDHPALSRCLVGLTLTALMAGEPSRAQDYNARNLALAEQAFGARGLRVSLLLDAAVATVAGESERALASGLRAAEAALAIQNDIYTVASDREVLLYAAHHRRVIGALLAALGGGADLSAGVRAETLGRIFDVVAREHGQVVDRFALRRRLALAAADTTGVGRRFAAYRQAVRELAQLAARGPRGEPAGHQAALADAREAKARAERALAEHSAPFRRVVAAAGGAVACSPSAVADWLDAGEVVHHYVRYPELTIGTARWRPGANAYSASLFAGGGDRYGAFVLAAAPPASIAGEPPSEARAAGRGHRLQFVDLGSAAAIDSLIACYRRAIDAAAAGGRPSARLEAEYRAAARSLHARLWAPLRAVGPPEASTFYLLPAERLHLLDFQTLLAPDGTLVIESGRVHLLSSVRDLAPCGKIKRGAGLLALGAPPGPHPLPAAVREVKGVAALYGATTGERALALTDSAATEEAFGRLLAGRRCLHLAAHGFFAPLETGDSTATAPDEDPLLQCGLLLGAGGGEDGRLSAQEIVTHDLEGVECVVLSACGSGLGPLVPGEGLYGLRRAFEMAGAERVMMALWRVGDERARDMLAGVYRRYLDGDDLGAAVRAVELERLAEVRRRWHRLHPVLWAGWVVEGRPVR